MKIYIHVTELVNLAHTADYGLGLCQAFAPPHTRPPPVLRKRPVARERFFFIGWADSTGEWVDSIRQVEVDLNFLLVLYSTVGLYRLVCLFGRLDICWENFSGGQNTLAAHPML